EGPPPCSLSGPAPTESSGKAKRPGGVKPRGVRRFRRPGELEGELRPEEHAPRVVTLVGDDVAAQEVQRQVRVVAVVRAGVELDGMVAVHAAAASGAAGTAAGRPVLGGGDVADAARHG